MSGAHIGRPYNAARLERIAEIIRQQPGLRQRQVALACGVYPCVVYVALPLLEERGVLLSEDDEGRLYYVGERREQRP